MSMMNEQDYLNKVKDIVREAEEETREKALDFNIFDTLSVGEKEVMMCRVLYEFLNSKGSHGRGTEYLELFFKDVLGFADLSDDEIKSTKVYREYVIKDTDRRIDIYIDSPYRAIPIEVKIYAEEQENQCLDYYKYADKENQKKREQREWKLVYLTLFGDMPSGYSTGKNKDCKDSILKLSWGDKILEWLKRIEKSQSNNVNVREITKQYISVVEKLTNQKKGLVYKKMEENGMLSGKDNMKAAQAISQCFEMRKINLIEDIFEKTKEKAGEVLTSDELKICFVDPWDNRSLIKNYYQYQKSTYPSLNYVVKEFTDSKYGNKYQIWIRFELDFRPFIGLNLVKVYQDKNGEIKYTGDYDDKSRLMDEASIYLRNTDKGNRNSWWMDWFYVPSFNTEIIDNVPNFKDVNDSYYDLYEDEKLNEFVDAAVQGLKKMKERVLAN